MVRYETTKQTYTPNQLITEMTAYELYCIAEHRLNQSKDQGMGSAYAWQKDVLRAGAAIFMIEDSDACRLNFKFDNPPIPTGMMESAMNDVILECGGDPAEWTLNDIFPWFTDDMTLKIRSWIYDHEEPSPTTRPQGERNEQD